jgi:tetratricopeptide (TPR) repeat protein
LIREGVTGVAGSVAETYFAGSVRPQVLFPAYASGFNLAEAFYLATPRLSWRTVIIGDPLVAAFPRKSLTRRDLEDENDTVTGLPAHFSARRIRVGVARAPGTSQRAVALNMRGEMLLRRGDRRGAREAFEEALKLAPNYVSPLISLAVLESDAEQHASSIARYRRVVQLEPKNVPALNNLAYALAVHEKNPREALPLARRAAALAPNDPNILDTLAWVYHLLNDNATAAKVMAQALRSSPPSPRIRLNAAIIYAAAGAVAVAETQLRAALALDPTLEDSDEVRALREQLEKGR